MHNRQITPNSYQALISELKELKESKILNPTDLNFTSILIKWFEHDYNFDGLDSKGYTPLGYACFINSLKIAQLLIQHGAEANSISQNEASPIVHGNLEKKNFIFSPLFFAIYNKNEDLVRLLIENDADLSFSSPTQPHPLIHALNTGQLNIFKLLLEHGAEWKKPLLSLISHMKFITAGQFLKEVTSHFLTKVYDKLVISFKDALESIKSFVQEDKLSEKLNFLR